MDCPKCGTWNPDDKRQCWRCGTPLPPPQEKKPPRQHLSPTAWLWIALALFVLMLIIQQCLFRPPEPMGFYSPSSWPSNLLAFNLPTI